MNLRPIAPVLVTFIDLFVLVFDGLLLARVAMSWITPDLNSSWLGRLLVELTEPILVPVRRILPQGQMVDWAPLATFFLLQIIRYGLYYLISRLI